MSCFVPASTVWFSAVGTPCSHAATSLVYFLSRHCILVVSYFFFGRALDDPRAHRNMHSSIGTTDTCRERVEDGNVTQEGRSIRELCVRRKVEEFVQGLA